ncbi:hypothetical protein JCM10908_002997 [Rhodotorula pacifica]|uniref:uncharacterized protein n=1 Tax=Rhodotorula pacifica TaxID=1495444 RepID=UPI00316B03F6
MRHLSLGQAHLYLNRSGLTRALSGLLSGLSGLQSNAGTSNGDDKGTDAALASLTGSGPQPTGTADDPPLAAAGKSAAGAASPVGLMAAAITDPATSETSIPEPTSTESETSTLEPTRTESETSSTEPSSTDSAASAAAVTPAPTLPPTLATDVNSTADSSSDAAAPASSNLTFDLAGFLSGADFDPAATAPAGSIAEAAPTASA